MSLKVLGLMAYFMSFFASSRMSFIYVYVYTYIHVYTHIFSSAAFFVPVKIHLAKLGTVVKKIRY